MATYTGTNLDDLITSEADIISARKGNDTIHATNAVAATVQGGEGADLIFYDGAGSASLSGGDAGDTVTGGGFEDTLAGENGADLLFGGDGGDWLFGNDGLDQLFGGLGLDTLVGGNNDDILDGGGGADRLDGGVGLDAASYQSSAIGVRVDLANPAANTGDAAGDVFVSIENLVGSDFNDVLKGDNAANLLVGGLGNDVLAAGGNADRVKGGEGNDTLQGQGGNDTLEGETGNDLLSGGGGSRDLFVFHEYGLDPLTRSWGHDTISDFEDGIDALDFRNTGAFGSPITFDSLTISQQGADTLIVGPNDGESILLLNRPADTVTVADFIFL
jgi:Ca2+-binding RTX toxin-like protein